MSKKILSLSVLAIILIAAGFYWWNNATIKQDSTNNTEKTNEDQLSTTEEKFTEGQDSKDKSIDGLAFRLLSFNGVDVSATENYTLSFTDTALSARFCNGLGGEYEIKNNTIIAESLVGTLMYCETGNVMEMENSFGTMLRDGAEFNLTNNTLTFTGKSGTKMVFELLIEQN